MGCTQSSYATPPNLPAQLITRLIQVSDVNHQLNVNVKYQYLCKIDQTKTTGHGLKKVSYFLYQDFCIPLSYHQIVTPIKKKIILGQVFIKKETRNSGSPQSWNALTHVVMCKSDDQMISLLHKAKITPLNGSIQMCVDPKGSKYQLPVFVINDPISYESQKIADRNLVKDYQKCNFKLKIRTVKFPNEDIVLDVNSDILIEEIKKMIRQNKQLGNASIRMFYNGREMLDNRTLGNYGYMADTVIQAMIK